MATKNKTTDFYLPWGYDKTSICFYRVAKKTKEAGSTAEQSYASGRDYCESGSPRLASMSDEWLAGYDAAATEHRKYAESIELT